MMMMSKEGSAMPLSLAKVAGLVTVSRATGHTARHRRNWSKCRCHPGLRATAVLISACPGQGRGWGVWIIAVSMPTGLLHHQLELLHHRPHLGNLLVQHLAHFSLARARRLGADVGHPLLQVRVLRRRGDLLVQAGDYRFRCAFGREEAV